MRRIVVLGTGTGVGKTHVTEALARALQVAGVHVQASKPVETGIRPRSSAPPPGSDAERLERASSIRPLRPHPRYAFPRPVSPHLEAARLGKPIRIAAIRAWVGQALHDTTLPMWQLIETAGGVFSPLSPRLTNFDLAAALDPAVWILVAPDALGVLHDVRATLLAMRTRGRTPDHLVLTASRPRDASTGQNAAELFRVGLPRPSAVLSRSARTNAALSPLVRALLAARRP